MAWPLSLGRSSPQASARFARVSAPRVATRVEGACFPAQVGRIYFWETGVSVHDTRADHVLLGSKGLWYVAREVGFAAEHFSYMLLAAFTLNVT